MKFHFDRKYLKISLYVVLTAAAAYLAIICLNAAAYALLNSSEIFGRVASFFRTLAGVFAPVIIAFTIAYILDPLVEFYEKKFAQKSKKPDKRTIGTSLTYLTIVAVIAALVVFAAIKIGGTDGFTHNISAGVARTLSDLNDFYAGVRLSLIDVGMADYLSGFFDGIMRQLTSLIANISQKLENGLSGAGSAITSFLLAFIIAFYFLRDKARIKAACKRLPDTFLSERRRRRLYRVLEEINAVFSGYIRGQLTDALIMAVLLSVGLTLCGVRFAVVIGIFSGLANVVPYFGALTAFVVSTAVALVSGSPSTAIAAAVVVIVLQQIDGIFIVPRVVGQKVELSPVLVIISLAVSGRMFGFWGLVFAVPLFAVCKIFVQRVIKNLGAPPQTPPGPQAPDPI